MAMRSTPRFAPIMRPIMKVSIYSSSIPRGEAAYLLLLAAPLAPALSAGG
jgi:hypothetical protein